MELKTKEGKYFSELGSWTQLLCIIFLAISFKIFGMLGGIVAALILFGASVVLDRRKRNIKGNE